MRITVFVLCLLGFSALAQDGVTRGDALRRREYQTYAPVNLFVDPAGNNSNACTAAGTAACATVTGALAKLPRFLRNNVTIDVANGTYTDAFTVQDFQSNVDAVLTIQGSLVNSTLASGSATGTLTGVVTNTSAAIGTLTDSAQTWTASDLRGRFITFTSGPASGSTIPIVDNTATQLTLSTGGISAPGVGNTYSIQEPGAVFNLSGTVIVRNISSRSGALPAAVVVQRMTFSRTGAGSPVQVTGEAFLQVATSRIIAGTSSAFTTSGWSAGRIDYNNNYTESASAGATIFITGGTRAGPMTFGIGTGNGFARNTSTGVALSILGASAAFFSGVYESATTTNAVVQVINEPFQRSSQNPNTYVRCTAGPSTNSGLRLGSVNGPSSASGGRSGHTFNGNVGVTGCGIGVQVNAGADVHMLAPAFDNVTTAIEVNRGSTFDFNGSTPTFTTVTTELLLDGAPYTFSTLSSLPTPAYISNPRGSIIYR